MKRKQGELDEPEDDIEEIDLPEDEEEAREASDRPIGRIELATTLLTLLAACAMLVVSILRTTIGMYDPINPRFLVPKIESIKTMTVLILVDLPIIAFSARSMRLTRGREGTALRGASVAASAISLLVELILGNSLVTLLGFDR